ncbi:MAG: hypothetical protein QMC80_07530 [Thermoplasmatales archaeon]|nr:hypothetical protein [Thermoplasmatales archaeon]
MAKIYLARDKKKLVVEAETASELVLLQRAMEDGIIKKSNDVTFTIEKQ